MPRGQQAHTQLRVAGRIGAVDGPLGVDEHQVAVVQPLPRPQRPLPAAAAHGDVAARTDQPAGDRVVEHLLDREEAHAPAKAV